MLEACIMFFAPRWVRPPNKNQISTFMRALPSVQINKTTKSVAGKKNVIGPMIPPPIPLGWCAADTGFIPACYNPVDKRVYKAIIVYICGLTKYFTCIRVRLGMPIDRCRPQHVMDFKSLFVVPELPQIVHNYIQ